MSRPPIPTATVALIAAQIIERGVNFGTIGTTDFSDYQVPASEMTYRERTMNNAAKEAWELVEAVEQARPQEA